MDTILIIGGAGFLGLHLISEFSKLEKAPKIHVLDIRPIPDTVGSFYSFDPKDITVHIKDLTSEEQVTEVLKTVKPDVIVHSASPVHGLGEAAYRKVNIHGTKNLIECARKTKVPAIVFTSSAGVVFNGDDIHNVDETWPYPVKPMDAYNYTKQIAETMIVKANSPEISTVSIRPSGIFGPGDRQMIPVLRDMGRQNKHRFQLGDNLNLFDVTYVGNVAYAHVLAAQKVTNPTTRKLVAGEIFTVTNDSPIYFWSMGRAVWKADGKVADKTIVIPKSVAVFIAYLAVFFCFILRKEPTLTPFRVRTSCATRYYNISKAKKILGYKAITSIEEGIQNTLDAMDEAEKVK